MTIWVASVAVFSAVRCRAAGGAPRDRTRWHGLLRKGRINCESFVRLIVAFAPRGVPDYPPCRRDRSLTRPVPQLVGARRLRTLLLSDVDYLKGADARSPTAATPDATARHRPLRLPVMGLPPRYTVANRPLRPTFSNLDSALCTHVPPNTRAVLPAARAVSTTHAAGISPLAPRTS